MASDHSYLLLLLPKTRKEIGKKIVPFHRPFSVCAKTYLVTCDSLNERSDIEVYCEFFLLQCLTI